VLELIDRVKAHTPKRSLDSLDHYCHGELIEEAQDDGQATHCGKIIKEDGQIDMFLDPLQDVYKKYKAYALWPKIASKLNTKN
jgi:methionyl-tRNA formyltransferase